MSRGHPLFERVDDLIHRVADMGLWSVIVDKYLDSLLMRTMVRRMRIIFNHQHGLNNTQAIARFNEALLVDMWEQINRLGESNQPTQIFQF